MATLNPKFYQTTDNQYVINIDDISLIQYVFVSNEYDSYYLLYMKSSTNGIKITARDGICIINIMILSDNYGLYSDKFIENDSDKQYAYPIEKTSYIVTSFGEITSGKIKTDKNSLNNSADYKNLLNSSDDN